MIDRSSAVLAKWPFDVNFEMKERDLFEKSCLDYLEGDNCYTLLEAKMIDSYVTSKWESGLDA